LESGTKELQLRLQSLRDERQHLTKELARLDEESHKLEELEQMFFEDANDFRYALENVSDQHAAVRQKIREVKHHLEVMKSTNVFDDAFHIYNDGHFGTINGLRLGRLTSVEVGWEEINAALGQCVLLLDVLTKRVKKFTLKGFELYPLGICSEIHETKKGTTGGLKKSIHQMYGSQKLFGYSGCDKALECFLECMNQFCRWIQTQDKKFKMRYQFWITFTFHFFFLHIFHKQN
ncbi:autophagy protein Apg6 family protein, partial [Reticulomyxa filosa]